MIFVFAMLTFGQASVWYVLVFSMTTTSPRCRAAQPAVARRAAAKNRITDMLRILFDISCGAGSEPGKPVIPLVFPVPARFFVCDDKISDPFRALVSQLRRHDDPKGRA